MKTINVKFNLESLEKIIKKELKGKNADVLSHAVVQLLEDDEDALSKLFMAALGQTPEDNYHYNYHYKENDLVYINTSDLYSWDLDKEESIKKGYMTDELCKVTIESINYYTGKFTYNYWALNKEHKETKYNSKEKLSNILSLVEELPI